MKNEEGWRMLDDGNESYDEGSDEGGDKVEWLILRCRD